MPVAPDRPPPAAYPDAAIRGQMRQWKTQLARRYQSIERALRDPVVNAAAADLAQRSAVTGRRRAFDKLARHFGNAVTLEGLRIDGQHQLAVWSALRPRASVATTVSGDPRGQDCVTLNYLMAGAMPPQHDGNTYALAEGLWSLEIPDHALGRVLHRSGGALLPHTIIAEAHHHLLQLRTALLIPADGNLDQAKQFLVRAGPGGFVCRLVGNLDVSIGGLPMLYAQAQTWLAEDMLRDDQVLLVPDGAPGERLIDGWLLPKPIRQIIPIDDEGRQHVVASWLPGLPDLLAAPKGRA